MTLPNDQFDDATWSPRPPYPAGLTLENLRKAGEDKVCIDLTGPNDLVRAIAVGSGLAAGCMGAGVATGFLPLGCWAAIGVLTSLGFWLHDRPPAKWRISILPDKLVLTSWNIWRRQTDRREVDFTSIEGFAVTRRAATQADALIITTGTDAVVFGHGAPPAALHWLKYYLIMEFAGLTWRPIKTSSDRALPTPDAQSPLNPIMLKPDLAKRLISIFEAEAPSVAQNLHAAIAAGDAGEIRRHAHWLKSASANVGARQLSELCQIIEHCAIDNDLVHCPILGRELASKLPLVLSWLQRVKREAEEKNASMTDARRPAPASPTLAYTHHSPLKAHILVADDSAVSREIAIEFLSELVTDVTFADDGDTAVAAWTSGTFDMIFMDCEMLRMSGLDATREIRRREQASDRDRVPIVALTGATQKSDRDMCLAAGMDDYISKPYSPEALKGAIGRWLGHGAAQTELRAAASQMRAATGHCDFKDDEGISSRAGKAGS